jgi:mannose-6-phosphate isomerase-like protein (cupin superfamily)
MHATTPFPALSPLARITRATPLATAGPAEHEPGGGPPGLCPCHSNIASTPALSRPETRMLQRSPPMSSPGRGAPPLHLHHGQDEVFLVEEGEYRFQCGERFHLLGPGDTIWLPRQVPHSFCQRSPTGRLRYLYTPAGRMEEFFTALASQPHPPEPARGAALFAAHGMQVVGPPLGPG